MLVGVLMEFSKKQLVVLLFVLIVLFIAFLFIAIPMVISAWNDFNLANNLNDTNSNSLDINTFVPLNDNNSNLGQTDSVPFDNNSYVPLGDVNSSPSTDGDAPGITDLCLPYEPDTNLMIAIASDTTSYDSIISSENANAPFFLLIKDKVEKGLIDNNKSKVTINGSILMSTLVRLLKQRNVGGVVLSNPDKNFVDSLKSKRILCYTGQGVINQILGLN